LAIVVGEHVAGVAVFDDHSVAGAVEAVIDGEVFATLAEDFNPVVRVATTDPTGWIVAVNEGVYDGATGG